MKLPSLGAYPPPIFIPVKTFTKAATFGSNPPGLLFPGLLPLLMVLLNLLLVVLLDFLLGFLLQTLLQILIVDFVYC